MGPVKLSSRKTDVFQAQLRKELPSKRFHLSSIPELRLPELSKKELEPEPTAMAAQAGVHRLIGNESANFSRWSRVGTDRLVWRLGIESPGAEGVRVHFSKFDVGKGRVWLHDGSGRESEIMGPYTGKGLYNDGEFWSDFVLSDKVVIEYEPETAPETAVAEPPFTIAEITHLVQGVVPGPKTAGPEDAATNGPQAGDPPSVPQAEAACHLDVTCYPDWAETAKAVAHIVYEKQGRSYVCSGTLVADRARSGTPYFLTADHCVDSDTVARTMQVFWSYQSSTCNGPGRDRRDSTRTLGAQFLVSGGLDSGDYALVRLLSVPDGVTFAGWDPEEKAVGTQFAGIHHPAGAYKRISFSSRVTTRPGLAGADLTRFYTVNTNEGRTEGGSSGSGLFTQPGVLAGTLSYGPKTDPPKTACDVSPSYNGYGRFSSHFGFIRSYLEGRTATPGAPPPADGGNPVGTQITSGRPVEFSVGPVTGATLFSGANSFRVEIPQGATRMEIKLASAGQVGFIVRKDQPPAVVGGRAQGDYTSPGNTGNESLVVNSGSTPPLQAGTYYIGVALFTTGQQVSATLT
ncbi:MAG: trypsin-like peptidase domain-containing protein, partial [Bryobacteraceae bacterium]|nr:trypsin-like peptidase domain-containing protein [Bryobacteraceae bacterium]